MGGIQGILLLGALLGTLIGGVRGVAAKGGEDDSIPPAAAASFVRHRRSLTAAADVPPPSQHGRPPRTRPPAPTPPRPPPPAPTPMPSSKMDEDDFIQEHSVLLSPCIPSPIRTDCTAVHDIMHHDMLYCMHVTFDDYGQEARSTNITYTVNQEVDAGLTLVLLVGSVFYFEDQVEMYNFLQPKILASMEGKHGYDPTNKGPCMSESQIPSWLNHTTKGGGVDELTTCSAASDAFRDHLLNGDDTHASSSQDPGKFAYLYFCNATSSASGSRNFYYDQLRPDDYPFTYWIFINGNPNTLPSTSSSLQQERSLSQEIGQNQTVRYNVQYAPEYQEKGVIIPEPLFVIFFVIVIVYSVFVFRYISSPFSDWFYTSRLYRLGFRRL